MRNIGIGSWGKDVESAQQMLNTFGYNLEANSIFGTETRDAVKDFQETHIDESGAPLIVDGIIGPKTWWALTHSPAVRETEITTEKNTALWIGLGALLVAGYLLLNLSD